MAENYSKSPVEAIDEYFDMLVKSRFVEMFGTLNNPKYGLIEISELVSKKIAKVGKTYLPEDTIQYIDISSIIKESRSIGKTTEYLVGEAPSRAQQCVINGDILFSNVRPNLKTIAIVNLDQNNLVCSSGFTVLRCEKCEPECLISAVIDDAFTDLLVKKATGTSYPAVTTKDVVKQKIPFGPRDIQNEFADFVKQVDKSKLKFHKLMESYDALIKSRFVEMFGDIYTNNKGFPTTTFENYVTQMNIGPFGSDLKNDCFVSKNEGYCGVYTQKHAIEKDFTIEKYVTKSKYEQLKRFKVGPGDIIVSCRGTVGKCAILPDYAKPGIIHPSLMLIKPNTNVNPQFLLVLLERILKVENQNGTGVKMAIKATDLAKIRTIFPPKKIQDDYIDFIKHVDKSKFEVINSLLKLKDSVNSTISNE